MEKQSNNQTITRPHKGASRQTGIWLPAILLIAATLLITYLLFGPPFRIRKPSSDLDEKLRLPAYRIDQLHRDYPLCRDVPVQDAPSDQLLRDIRAGQDFIQAKILSRPALETFPVSQQIELTVEIIRSLKATVRPGDRVTVLLEPNDPAELAPFREFLAIIQPAVDSKTCLRHIEMDHLYYLTIEKYALDFHPKSPNANPRLEGLPAEEIWRYLEQFWESDRH